MALQDHKVLRIGAKWQDLRLYKKSDALYQFTFTFCKRFLPPYGDRTVDQMVQAARSGKQNIVEGSEDGKTSTQMELNLINVARSSINELREDYKDYLIAHNLPTWQHTDPSKKHFQEFTRTHNEWKDYEELSEKWTAEEMANIGLTLCFQMDTMLNHYLKKLEEQFVKEGGIKERMYAARTGYRQEQDERLQQLETQNQELLHQVNDLQQQLSNSHTSIQQWQQAYAELKQRALTRIHELESQLTPVSDI